MDKANAEKNEVEGKLGLAAVAASQTNPQIILTSTEGAVQVMTLSGAGVGQKEVYHVTKNPDGTFKVHSLSTNVTTQISTVCPNKKNETIKTCVALTFNQD